MTASLTVAACGSSSTAKSTGPIPLGFVAPLTGIGASAGVGALEGADVALKAITAAAGVLGRQLNLIIGNDNTDCVDALPVVQKQLSVDNVVASYGPDSDLTDAVTRYYVGAHVPAIIWGGQDPQPTYISPYIWRITPADSQLGVAMALNAWLKGYRNAAFLFGNDDNGKALGTDVAAAWKKLGGSTAVTVAYTPGQTSYRSEVQQIVNAHPDVIYVRSLATDAGAVFNLNELEGLSFRWLA